MAPHAVLVVEDSPELRFLVATLLERAGFGVRAAGDAEAALALAREAPPDVAVVDLLLPGDDGLEVCRRLRELCDARTLILSAGAWRPPPATVDAWMTKPFLAEELVARVRVLAEARSAAAAGEPGA